MGFWKDVRELRELVQKEVDAGQGSDALKIAMKKQRAEPNAKEPEKRGRKKLFILSFLAGVIWQRSKRTR